MSRPQPFVLSQATLVFSCWLVFAAISIKSVLLLVVSSWLELVTSWLRIVFAHVFDRYVIAGLSIANSMYIGVGAVRKALARMARQANEIQASERSELDPKGSDSYGLVQKTALVPTSGPVRLAFDFGCSICCGVDTWHIAPCYCAYC